MIFNRGLSFLSGQRLRWIFAAAMLLGLSSCGEDPNAVEEVEPVPTERAMKVPTPVTIEPVDVELTAMSLQQLRDRLSDLKGKIVVVDLWALW